MRSMFFALSELRRLDAGRHVVVLGDVAAPDSAQGAALRAALASAADDAEDLMHLSGAALDQAMRISLMKRSGLGLSAEQAQAVREGLRARQAARPPGTALKLSCIHARASALRDAGIGARELRVLRSHGISVWIWASALSDLAPGAFARAVMGEAPCWLIDPAVDAGRAMALLEGAGHLSPLDRQLLAAELRARQDLVWSPSRAEPAGKPVPSPAPREAAQADANWNDLPPRIRIQA